MPILDNEKSLFSSSYGFIELTQEVNASDLMELKELLAQRADIKRILKFKLSADLIKNPEKFFDWFESIPHLMMVDVANIADDGNFFHNRFGSQKNKLSKSIQAKYEWKLANKNFPGYSYQKVVNTLQDNLQSEPTDNDLFLYNAALLYDLSSKTSTTIQDYHKILLTLERMKIKKYDYYYQYDYYLAKLISKIILLPDDIKKTQGKEIIKINEKYIHQIEEETADDDLKIKLCNILDRFDLLSYSVKDTVVYKKVLEIKIKILSSLSYKDCKSEKNLDCSRVGFSNVLLEDVVSEIYQLNFLRANEILKKINGILALIQDQALAVKVKTDLIACQNTIVYPYTEWRHHFHANLVTMYANATIHATNFGLHEEYFIYLRVCGALLQAEHALPEDGMRILDDLNYLFLVKGAVMDETVKIINPDLSAFRTNDNFLIALRERIDKISEKHHQALKRPSSLLKLVGHHPSFQIEVAVQIENLTAENAALKELVTKFAAKFDEQERTIKELKETVGELQKQKNDSLKIEKTPVQEAPDSVPNNFGIFKRT